MWTLIQDTPAGFPWLEIAGKTLADWLVIDMDATLVTASSDKQGAAPTWKKGYGFHPLGAWLANTRECLAMQLRPGNAGSNTFTDHKEVLAAAIRQVPARFRGKILVRVDGAGARTGKAMGLRNLPSKTWQVNCGWVIAANIAADVAAWTRLLGLHDDPELRDADPDTLRYRIWHIPARLARHARERLLKISPNWPWKEAFLTCWRRL